MKPPTVGRASWVRGLLTPLILSALIQLWHIPAVVLAEGLPSEAVVEKVIDGDTVILMGGEKVRYLGINAPETMAWEADHWVKRPQMFGEKAKQYNRQLVRGRKVTLEYDEKKRDAYHRLLAYVRVGEVFVNGELVRQGLALADVRTPNVRYQKLLFDFQQEAKDHGHGLWGKIREVAIPAEEAHRYFGKMGVVEGTITTVHRGRGRVYLRFGGDRRADFTCIIYNENLFRFSFAAKGEPSALVKKLVRVYGCIKNRRGAVIVISAPSQLEIIG
jgi:micrococcal nuclease